jgi:cell division protein FtsW (lipid II flippase)
MISLNQIQSRLFKREKKFKKEGSWLNIYFYWKFVLGIVFVAILLSLFLGYSLFTETDRDFVLSGENFSQKSKLVRKKRIDSVLEYFRERKEKTNQIINSSNNIIDPSL